MALPKIVDENDYQTCVRRARLVGNFDKIVICPNFKHVFHAELEINLNWNFINQSERWYLYFTRISLPPGWHSDDDVGNSNSAQIFTYPPDILIIYHNAKIKYRCLDCPHEWASAQGRAVFQTETPRMGKYNFLFVNLCTQNCRFCGQEIQPSWYLYEATRVMKNVCRILIERFYSDRNYPLPLVPPEEHEQQASQTRGHHQQYLCQACREGSCYWSNRPHQRRN